jgi:hypothetical protein
MKMSRLGICLIGSALALGALTAAAQAQATRTWVSGVGDDVNPCSRTAPCKTFAGAISKTAPNGEIDVLDPGGFGAVTITKSISIYNDGVGESGVLVSGTNGIVINAGPTDVVNLRGLVIDGLNTSGGQAGVSFLAGAQLNISNCVIQEMGTGVSFTPGNANASMHIQDTLIANNSGVGISLKPSAGFSAKVTLDRVRVVGGGGGGMKSDGTAGGGPIMVSVNDSTFSNNASNGINAVSGNSNPTNVNIMRSVVSNNGGNGIQSNQVNGGTATVTVGSSIINSNNQNLNALGGGALLSYQTNQVLNSINGLGGFSNNTPLQ